MSIPPGQMPPAQPPAHPSDLPPAGGPEESPPPADASSAGFQERRSRTTGWHSKDVVRTAALVIGIYLVVQLLWFAHALVFAAFLGLLFGLAVEAGVDRLERFRIPRGVGAALIVFGFFGLLVGFGAAMAPTVREQGRELRERVPEAVDKIQEWVESRREGLLGMFIGAPAASRPDTAAVADARDTTAQPESRPDTAGAAATDTGARAPTARDAGAPRVTETMRDGLGRQLSGATRFLFPFLSQTIAVVAGILLIIMMAIYIAAEPNLYHRGLMHLFPHRARARAGEVLSAIATVLRRWLVTQLIAMVSIGTVTTIALLILKVEAAFALGLLAGLLAFVPNVGPILSAVPAVAMAFLISPEKALAVIGVYVGIQLLENHLLTPMLMKGGVDLPPVLTILSQALFTLLFGFLGLMVAVPMLAAVMVVVKMLYVEGVVGDEVHVAHAKGSG